MPCVGVALATAAVLLHVRRFWYRSAAGAWGYARGSRRTGDRFAWYTAAGILKAVIAKLAAPRSHNPKVVSSIRTDRIQTEANDFRQNIRRNPHAK